jgi:hypothetical protein
MWRLRRSPPVKAEPAALAAAALCPRATQAPAPGARWSPRQPIRRAPGAQSVGFCRARQVGPRSQRAAIITDSVTDDTA